MRVLIAEDDPTTAAAVARGLRREGLAVDVAHDGRLALDAVRLHGHDVVVLDRDMPGMHGDDVCRAVAHEQPGTRVLMLTGSASRDEVVRGLGLGADDYMAKPFHFPELVARVRALGRRSGPARPPVLRWGDLELDPARRVATRDGRELDLVNKELAVLEALLEADGGVLSAEDLLRGVWDENADPFTNVVRQTMMTLRRKLGDPSPIETVIGSGYRMR